MNQTVLSDWLPQQDAGRQKSGSFIGIQVRIRKLFPIGCLSAY